VTRKNSLETLNRTLKDLNRNDRHVCGALHLFLDNLRQNKPIITRSTYMDEIKACLKSSVF